MGSQVRESPTPIASPARTRKLRATISDVAAEAGVSKSTVSLAMQGSPRIRAETSRRVQEAAHSLGYVYNRCAADLRRRTSGTIGVVINDLTNPFFAEVLVGLERRFVASGRLPLMANTGECVEQQDRVLLTMRQQGVAGIVLCPALDTPSALGRRLAQWGLPVVVLLRRLAPGPYDFVGADNVAGVRMAASRLLATGHRRIGFLGGERGSEFEQRLRGYRLALADHGVPADDALIVTGVPDRSGGQDALLNLLRRAPDVTAAVCYNDMVALGANGALGLCGRRTGQGFGLIGFDGLAGTAHSNPPLTTVSVAPPDLGDAAARLLLGRIARPALAPFEHIVRPSLLVRQSG